MQIRSQLRGGSAARRTAHGVLALALFGASGAMAAEEPAQTIDLGTFKQATLVDDVVVPVPSEIFGVLDKLGSPNWHEVLYSGTAATGRERPQQALLLGTVIAEGFIAVEAQDSNEVKKIGRTVLRLAQAIGVRESVTARSKAIVDAAEKKAWDTVRKELDKALYDVKAAMTELGDDELAQLVSLGGWLRGTEALTRLVSKNYSKDAAELLYQPVLLEYFQSRIAAMDADLKKVPLVEKIERRLGELAPLIHAASGEVPKKTVEDVHAITAELVEAVRARGT